LEGGTVPKGVKGKRFKKGDSGGWEGVRGWGGKGVTQILMEGNCEKTLRGGG